MTSNLDEKGLRSIIDEYDLFFIDVWGVLHNGINLFQNSVEVLQRLEENKKNYRSRARYYDFWSRQR